MSYVLKFWEPPAGGDSPADLDGIVRLLDRLHQSYPGQNPKFVALAERLTRRFPCITSPEAEGIPESEWAWSDGPLDGRLTEGVYSIGLQARMLDEVRPFVIQQANSLGLGVLDAQAGEAHLPNGAVLGAPPTARWPAPTAYETYSSRELEMMVFDGLASLLAPHGYKARKSDLSLKQTFKGGWHVISLHCQDAWGGNIEVNSRIDTRLDAMVELSVKILQSELTVKDTKRWVTTTLKQQQWMARSEGFVDGSSYKYMVGSRADVERTLEHLAMQWKAILHPTLEQLTTIEGMDWMLNTHPMTASLFFQEFTNVDSNILAAYLARSPQLNELCDELLANVQLPNHLERARKCVEYVRSHPLT